MRNLIICALLLVLTSCVETVVVGTVATGALVTREKSIPDTGKDWLISAKIEKEFLLNGIFINYEVEEQRVLLTGVVSDSETASKAVSLCWKIKDVKEVIDETQAADIHYGLFNRVASFGKDSIITWQIKTRLFFERNIASLNFEVTTVEGVAYLTGIAQDESELAKVNHIVAKTKGVKRVVSHIILASDSRA